MQQAARFHPKAQLWVLGREGLLPRLERDLPALRAGRPVAWFHAASLGEFEQGRPVIEAFRARYPNYFLFLTFFSPSGYEVRKNYAGVDYVAYLPSDYPANARRLVALLQPRIVFFIKYEFWKNYLEALHAGGAAIISVSAIFRPNQLFFKPYGRFYRVLLHYFDRIFVQNEESGRLLGKIGLASVVAGDTRFDRVWHTAETTTSRPEIAAFVARQPCLVVGSAWHTDRRVLAPALNTLGDDLRAIIVPHEIDEADLLRWEHELRGTVLRYSAYRAAGFVLDPAHLPQYLLIDNVGMLASLYRYGQLAYVGGAFGGGLHNSLEAAAFGQPVLFGNRNYKKFAEARALISQGAAFAVADAASLQKSIKKLLDEPAFCARSGKLARTYVEDHVGATILIMKEIEKIIDGHPG